MKHLLNKKFGVFVCSFAFLVSFAIHGTAQGFDRIERGRMKDILKIVKAEVKDNYYDAAYHGIDLDTRFKQADEKLDQATSTSQSLAIIAQTLIDFNDSHLFLVPPPTNLAVEYGWKMKAVGDKVFITQVKPGSDAEAKGLKIGDEIVAIGNFRPSKKELWKVRYYYNALSKRSSMPLKVMSPGETVPRDLEIKSEIKKLPQMITASSVFRLFDDFYEEENDKHRFVTASGVTVWRMPSFGYDPADVNGLVDKVKNSSGLILDLRGNGGGYVKTMEALVGNFFEKDVRVAEMKGRKKSELSIAKSRGANGFKGKLIVLIDSESGSGSEILARVIQLEGRGQVIGDVSAGAVMQSLRFDKEMGTESVIPFAISVTNADVIMTDGKSLEHVGVTPDKILIPTGADLAAGHDPVLAHAFEVLGVKATPAEAGKLFKYYWKK